MKVPKLKALEKNVLKYRALQMVLVLHEFESLKRFVINSIRVSDRLPGTGRQPRLPHGCKRPMEKALDILVECGVLSAVEKSHIEEYAALRNRIGHEIHRLVADVSDIYIDRKRECLHDYWALSRLERLRQKIENGMAPIFVMEMRFDDLIFEQAALAYKEELARLDKKITKQIAKRLARRQSDNCADAVVMTGSGGVA